MNAQMDKQSEDEPLDPAVERVRRKLVRFIVINLSILFLALMAVVGALVYRAMTSESSPRSGDAPFEAPLELGEGARIVSQSVAQDMLTVHVRTRAGEEEILVFRLTDGSLLGRFSTAFPAQAPAIPD